MNELETNDDEIHDSEDVESGSDTDDELKDDSTLVVLKNGLKIERKKTPRVIRYVRFNLKKRTQTFSTQKNVCYFLHVLTSFLDLTDINNHLTTKNILLLTKLKSTNTMLTCLSRKHR